MKSEYSTLLFDADNTLLNFDEAETEGLKKAFESFGINLSEEDVEIYSEINVSFWKRYEKGEILKSEIGPGRYDVFLKYLNREELKGLTAEEVNEKYMECLSECGNLIEGAPELLKYLKSEGYDIYIVTNGTGWIQDSRLKRSGLLPFLNGLFISDYIGFQKPKKEFFDAVFSEINEKDKAKLLVIGDSLSSDIKGAENAGLDYIWYNHDGIQRPENVSPEKEIGNINELFNLL